MTTIEEAWVAIEQLLATTTYSGHALQTEQQDAESAKDAKSTINKPHLRDAVRAGFLVAHVDGCAFEEFDSGGEWRECGQEEWLCDIGKRIEELGR